MKKNHRFELKQGGMTVAAVDSYDRDGAKREIEHYAFMYGLDGPVEIVEVTAHKKKANREAGEGEK